MKPRQACSSAAATARRSICLRSGVVLLLRRARSCCDAAQRDCLALMKLTRSQRCATRSVATTEWCGPGEQQELRFYAENAILWAKLAASAARLRVFLGLQNGFSSHTRMGPEASSLGRRETPALLLPGSKYLQDVKPG